MRSASMPSLELQPGGPPQTADLPPGRRSRRDVLRCAASAGLALAGCASSAELRLRGAGATLPARQYERWLDAFEREVPAVRGDYFPIGSGGGVRQLAGGAVDFAASDVELDALELELVRRPVITVPVALVAVGLAFRVDGVSALSLSLALAAAIFEGRIARWSDPALAGASPSPLPDLPITPVSRADGGGSTALFVGALARRDPSLTARVGEGRAARFPAGIAARASDGVAELVASVNGAIGYVEVDFAADAALSVASLESDDGGFVGPTLDAIASGRYPLTAPTYLVAPRDVPDLRRGAALARFVDWVLTSGQRMLGASAIDRERGLAIGLRPLRAATVASARDLTRELSAGGARLLEVD
ncbi:MAG: phosphate ABC transporter substrate-binding protein PstS [Polyangiaceae bacterium]